MVRISLLIPLVASHTLVGGVHLRKPASGFDSSAAICNNVQNRCCKHNYVANKTKSHANLAPMVIWTHGCAGSSAVMYMARDLANLSGTPVFDCGGAFELLADIVHGNYGVGVYGGAFPGFVKRAADVNRALLFKGGTGDANKIPGLMDDLSELHARVVPVRRQNAIDVALCTVHDCFGGWMPREFGYKVDASGKKAASCNFRGRGPPGNQTESETEKVVVNTDALFMNLHQITSDQDATDKFLQDHGVHAQYSTTSEELFAFEAGWTGMNASVSAWKSTMNALGVFLPDDVVRPYLAKLMTAHKVKTHSETIENIDEVKKVLDDCVLSKERKKKRRSTDGRYRTEEWCAKVKSMLRL